MSEQQPGSVLRTYADGSQSLTFPPSDKPTISVTLTRGGMHPSASRCPTRFNAGETVTLDVTEAAALMADGYAVLPGESLDLDETLVPVQCLAPFSLRGKSFHANDLAFLPAWFVAKAQQLELVGDPPKPEKKPELPAATKAAIENRRVQRQRATAREYLESIQ